MCTSLCLPFTSLKESLYGRAMARWIANCQVFWTVWLSLYGKTPLKKRPRIIRHNAVSREIFFFFSFFLAFARCFFYFFLFFFSFSFPSIDADATSINFIEVLFETFHSCPGCILIFERGRERGYFTRKNRKERSASPFQDRLKFWYWSRIKKNI